MQDTILSAAPKGLDQVRNLITVTRYTFYLAKGLLNLYFADLSNDVRLLFKREWYQVDLHEVHGQTEKRKTQFYSR